MLSGVRRCAVVGDPVDHSLSPVLHRAAYRALGLPDWSYQRVRVPAGGLAGLVAGLGPEWVGLSVTMPGKEEALALAEQAGEQARLVGAANTLVRDGTAGGWRAENTDVDGIRRALQEQGVRHPQRAALVGSGATARSALMALHGLGVREVAAVVRRQVRPETAALGDRLGVTLSAVPEAELAAAVEGADVLVSTVPPGASPVPETLLVRPDLAVLDVVYAPWPTPFAARLAAAGARVQGGGTMLVHQAAEQVRLMTGLEAPLAQMRAALAEALNDTGE
ncbi:shikimate dehydrogenase [Ornithinicoccus halotolerans]|uniref:shikimate dehydrogenase n=1 Tax=Ornithinicoccus halotolerans TaxID=1748220 RepID=UPI001297B01F|nr:shikimate dehydrogenase [Ornithinicoccus halotolerans]